MALSSVLLLCGAGSVPVENLMPQGAMQGDLNAGGHNLTNAATVYATGVSATRVQVTGLVSQSSVGTDSSGNLVAGSGSITLGMLNSGVLTLSGGVLDFVAAPNTANGLVQLNDSGQLPSVDGSQLSFLPPPTPGPNMVGVVQVSGGYLDFTSTNSDVTSVALGEYSINVGSYNVIIGRGVVNAGATGVVSVGENSSALGPGSVAIGCGAAVSGGDGIAIGASSSAASGIAIGNSAYEDGGGTALGTGAYHGHGIAINTDEIAIPNGSGFATLTGVLQSAPSSSTAAGVAGQTAYDANYFYVCTAANTWKRVALSSF